MNQERPIILLDEPQPVEPSRGMRICGHCMRRSLKLKETESHDIVADRGTIGATRTWLCTTNGCEAKTLFLDLCVGDTAKGTVRGRGTVTGTPSGIRVEDLGDRIVVKA